MNRSKLWGIFALLVVLGLGWAWGQDEGFEGPGIPQNLSWGMGGDQGSRNPSGSPMGKFSTLSWDAPDSGAAVHHYVAQVFEIGGASIDTTWSDQIFDTYLEVYVQFGMTYRARVAGVDSLNRQGPYSLFTPLFGPRASVNRD